MGEAHSKDGLFYRDTRYLSRLSLSINGTGLIELGHDTRDDDAGFRSDLANLRLVDSLGTDFLDFELHVRRERVLFDGLFDGLFDRVEITNFGTRMAELDLVIECRADFRDIFEVRGADPWDRGSTLPPEFDGGTLRFGYETADGRRLTTRVTLDPAPRFDRGRAHIGLSLPPKARQEILCTVQIDERPVARADPDEGVHADHGAPAPRQATPTFDEAIRTVAARMQSRIDRTARIRTSRPSFDAWLTRSSADLAILTADLPTGPYIHAGVPWFSVPFGRDGLITALQTLWLDAELAGGVLDFLAATQARTFDAFCDAEPGKILHEHRNGELARTGAVPFHHYYGGIDQTLLFVVLAHAHWTRTGDRDRLQRLLPAIRATLVWAAEYGDRDGDGLIEYARSAETGLRNQGWKVSDDAVFHADGALCASPVALVEVQGHYAAALRRLADALVDRVDAAFWDDDPGPYCIALDAEHVPVRVSTSNAGHLPCFGAALPQRLDRLPELWCGLPRRETAQPVAFPSAWAPQAWAAGAPFLCLQACLGIEIDGPARQIRITDPVLPADIDWLDVTDLRVGDCCARLRFRRKEGRRAELEILAADPALDIRLETARGSP